VKVSTERIPESQVLMTIEIEAERLDAARDRAVRKLSPKAKVPGFRPGKAPAAMVRRYFGEERVLDEALDLLVPDVYKEALDSDESIEPVARPRLVVETTEPLVVKATIPVRPTVELGDYTSVRIPAEEATVDEARVEETITILRRRAATHEPHTREIAWRDIIRIDVRAEVPPALTDLQATGPETMIDQQDIEIQLDEERDVLFPNFEEALLDHRKGETVAFSLTVPDDVQDPKFAGRQAQFSVLIKETKAEVLPELDDEFAKSLGDQFDSLDALRQRVRDDIRKVEEEARDNRYHDAILGELVERATIEFPPVMLDAEIDRVFHDRVGHFDKPEDLERYLAAIGTTAEEVRNEIRPIAELRLRRSLVLSKVAEAENIEATDEEIAAEIEKMTAAAGAQAAQLRQIFDTEGGRDTIRRNLLTRKSLARLVEIATQDGAAAAPTAEQEKPKRPRKSKKEEATTSEEVPAEETKS
jgi:trigger factor